jgi:hypothetical protein
MEFRGMTQFKVLFYFFDFVQVFTCKNVKMAASRQWNMYPERFSYLDSHCFET